MISSALDGVTSCQANLSLSPSLLQEQRTRAVQSGHTQLIPSCVSVGSSIAFQERWAVPRVTISFEGLALSMELLLLLLLHEVPIAFNEVYQASGYSLTCISLSVRLLDISRVYFRVSHSQWVW